MTTMEIFEGDAVRCLRGQDEPVWVGKDVCDVLGISKYRDALLQLNDDERVSVAVDTLGGAQQMTAVTEAGVYSLMLISRSPKVQAFKRWFTHEVLPAIRRTGTYTTTPALPDRKALAQMVIDAETARELAEAKVAEMAPKVEVAERLLDADGDLSVADTAKALTRAGVKVGESRLFTALKDKGWIYRAQGDGRWRVYQAVIESGHMSVLPASHYHPKTGVLVLDPPQPRVTPKGLQRLLADHGALVPVGGAA
jgi:anti-repressor protein